MKTALRVLRPVYKTNRKLRAWMCFGIVLITYSLYAYDTLGWWTSFFITVGAYLLLFLPESIVSYCHVNGQYKDPEKGVKLCQLALDLEPNSAIALLHLANCYSVMAMPSDALMVVSRAIELSPEQAELYCRRALLYSNHSNIKALILDANKAQSLAPKDGFCRYVQSLKLYAQGKYQDAIEVLKTVATPLISPDEISYLLFLCTMRLNRPLEAAAMVESQQNPCIKKTMQCVLAFDQSMYVELLNITSEPHGKNGPDMDLSYYRALALNFLNEPALAYQLTIDIQRRAKDGELGVNALLMLGLFSQAQMHTIVFELINYLQTRKIYILESQTFEIWLYLRLNRLEEAEEILNEWKSLDYQGPWYYTFKAMFLLKQGKEMQEARALAQKAYEMTPNNCDACIALAAVLMADGRPQEAATLLEKYLAKHPYVFEASECLSEAYELSGEKEKAKEISEKREEMLKLFQNELKQAMEENPLQLNDEHVLLLRA